VRWSSLCGLYVDQVYYTTAELRILLVRLQLPSRSEVQIAFGLSRLVAGLRHMFVHTFR
jgi:hypothetical protein